MLAKTAEAPVINTGAVADTSNIVAPPPLLLAVLGGMVLTVDWAEADQRNEQAKTRE